MRFLFLFIADVVAHSSVNKMSAENCAIVFAPNLIRPKVKTPTSMMTDMPSSISVIASSVAHQSTRNLIKGKDNGCAGCDQTVTMKRKKREKKKTDGKEQKDGRQRLLMRLTACLREKNASVTSINFVLLS
jgi:hypothetical protein